MIFILKNTFRNDFSYMYMLSSYQQWLNENKKVNKTASELVIEVFD